MSKIQIKSGEINIKLDGLDFKTVDRYRENIHQLMVRKAFEIKNGKVILHFDNEKKLRQIDIQMIAWRE